MPNADPRAGGDRPGGRDRQPDARTERGAMTDAFHHVGECTDAVSRAIEHFQACGEIVPSQLPSRSNWSPEKKLAAAVLALALVHVRDYHSAGTHRRAVQADLEWILSDDVSWPYSFIPLCHVLGLDPQWVRQMVHRWMVTSVRRARQGPVHRNAA